MDVAYKIIGAILIFISFALVFTGGFIFKAVETDYYLNYGMYLETENLNLDKFVENMQRDNINCADYNIPKQKIKDCYWKHTFGFGSDWFVFVFINSFVGLLFFGIFIIKDL